MKYSEHPLDKVEMVNENQILNKITIWVFLLTKMKFQYFFLVRLSLDSSVESVVV
ncbi:hypothetical protein P872_02505 [Rhodonellum psychrophilum GCM71 = DSM 17998]|uniref:Uncharacterized protein n=1 Tax=Rhodonellum psychrophilum GCM71 = DSM 17998 TaxID=1123057 RepID=U5C1K3_9BACT|nr:hypothetical protein P872_02505 [Rhodonellum psychrophilum GCM71 = DSM 17998]